MNHLIFDTETTGFYNPKLSPTSHLQARVIQLAAVKLDNELNEVEHLNVLIKPEEWFTMSEGAFNAHGISLEKCRNEGVSNDTALCFFKILFNDCGALVSHNYEFDSNMLSVEYKERITDNSMVKECCTMSLMTPICKLPHKRRNAFGQTYKWPKLIEALNFIGKPFVGKEHDGLSDARACAEIYRWLIKNNYIKFNAQESVENNLA